MSHHIVVVGTGRVGRPTAYTLLGEALAEEVSLVDIKPELAWAFGEELKHAAISLKLDIEINAYERDEEVTGADLIVICAGKPRIPGVKMSRRDLVFENARIIAHIAEVMPPRNKGARWVVVTNPVDAMATLFKKVSGESYVISTGDHPDTLRFRAKLADDLGVPYSKVEGYVGGEHGKAAHPLWSTVRIDGKALDEYLALTGKVLDREAIGKYVRGVSKRIVDVIGGTEYGPASAFRDIIRSILEDQREIYSVAVSREVPGVPEEVNVNVPIHVGHSLGPDLWEELTEGEKEAIIEAAKAIYETYKLGLEALGKTP